MKRNLAIFGFLLPALALCPPRASAQDGLRGAMSQIGQASHNALGFTRTLAPADFDNDSQPDGAVLSQAGWLSGQRLFRIDLHVTAGKDATITFLSAEPNLDISAVDVNGDGAPDIVVERAFTHRRLHVYLNDGHGTFQPAGTSIFSAQDDSAPLWQAAAIPQNPLGAVLPPTRGFELNGVHAVAIVRRDDAGISCFWPEVLLAQCGARAPSAARAPPASLLL